MPLLAFWAGFDFDSFKKDQRNIFCDFSFLFAILFEFLFKHFGFQPLWVILCCSQEKGRLGQKH